MNGLKLRSLILRGCCEIGNPGIGALCSTQSTLTELDLSNCSRITDVALSYIGSSLPKLETLSLQSCRAVTDKGISFLNPLNNLRNVNLQGLEHVTSAG